MGGDKPGAWSKPGAHLSRPKPQTQLAMPSTLPMPLGKRPQPCPSTAAYTASRGPAAAAVEELCEMGGFLSCHNAQIVQLRARNFMED